MCRHRNFINYESFSLLEPCLFYKFNLKFASASTDQQLIDRPKSNHIFLSVKPSLECISVQKKKCVTTCYIATLLSLQPPFL